MDSLLREKMPVSIQEIADVLGDDDTMKLVHAHGGTRLFVPLKVRAQHKLATLLGVEQAAKLCHMFGGESLTIARCVKLHKYQRNEEIRKKYDAGESTHNLVRLYSLTERQIYTILSSAS